MATVATYPSATWATTNSTNRTASFAGDVGDLPIVFVGFSGFVGTWANLVITDNQSGTYVNIPNSEFFKNASADYGGFWVRTALVASAVSHLVTVDVTTPGITHTGGGFGVHKVTGMTNTGTAAIRQSTSQNNQAGGGTPAPVFPSAPLTANAILGAVFNGANPAGLTQRASFSLIYNLGYNTPASGFNTQSRNSGDTSATQTWGSTSGSAFGSSAIELDTSSIPTPSDPLVFPGRQYHPHLAR